MEPKSINFVAFYVDISKNTLNKAQKIAKNVEIDANNHYLNLMFKSVIKHHKNSNFYIISDKNTEINVMNDVKIVRYKLDNSTPMLSRSIGWLNFLKENNNPTIFLDSDILIISDLSYIFSDTFHIGLTYRNSIKWPINAGIHFVNDINKELSISFYEEWLNIFKLKYSSQNVWGGDQDAIHRLLGELNYKRKDTYFFNLNNYIIKLLNCKKYNFSTNMEEPMNYIPKKVKVMHFKGNRKKYMDTIWNMIK